MTILPGIATTPPLRASRRPPGACAAALRPVRIRLPSLPSGGVVRQCRGRDLNPHEALASADFKTRSYGVRAATDVSHRPLTSPTRPSSPLLYPARRYRGNRAEVGPRMNPASSHRRTSGPLPTRVQLITDRLATSRAARPPVRRRREISRVTNSAGAVPQGGSTPPPARDYRRLRTRAAARGCAGTPKQPARLPRDGWGQDAESRISCPGIRATPSAGREGRESVRAGSPRRREAGGRNQKRPGPR